MYVDNTNLKLPSSNNAFTKNNIESNLYKDKQLSHFDYLKLANNVGMINKANISVKKQQDISFGFDPITLAAVISWVQSAFWTVLPYIPQATKEFLKNIEHILDERETEKKRKIEELARTKAKELEELERQRQAAIRQREENGKARSAQLLRDHIEMGMIDPKLNIGLNKVMGREVEKFDLIIDTVAPIVATMNEDEIYQDTESLTNGILFFGPPGCGKSYLARALGEHLKKKGCNFVEISRGTPETRMNEARKAFNDAKDLYNETGKFTVIFIDELEYLAPEIKNTPERMNEVNELKLLTDKCSKRGILWIGASNNFELIDSALKRRGRIDKHIPIGPVTKTDIAKILNYHLESNGKVKSDIDYEIIVNEATSKKAQYIPNDIADIAEDVLLKYKKTGEPIITDDILTSMQKIRPSLYSEDIEAFENDIEYAKDSGYLDENYEI